MNNIFLTAGRIEDAQRCGSICYEAFKTISGQHGFPADFPSPDIATGLMSMMLQHPGIFVFFTSLRSPQWTPPPLA
jgi:hypothetical protein